MAPTGLIDMLDHYVVGRSFTNYIKRFDIYCKLNNVPEDQKRSYFITLSGEAVYDELAKLYPDVDVETVSYADIVKKLKSRFDKVDPALMQRYRFYNRFQGQAESSENFVLAVKL